MKKEGRPTESRFRSRSEHSLDEKGRLSIPARFREILHEEYNDKLVVTNWHKCLKAYPPQAWEDIETTLLNQGKKEPGMAEFRRYVISGVTECPVDRQGRILLPATLRTDFDLKREVVLNGMLDHFEIWDKAAWDAETRRTRENFQNFEQSLSTLGIL
ncbi:MAG: division/cell wall cluster transcriptional repressor MraZ [Deltaproteobacteria bacterium RIFOXYD12_FULL_57_12]|nr:MAG: division/cell wall cluster transcriptional repressor MraZ [Deltaproteobacteria bacterium RIFOXYD12_FULL_57_12]